MIKLHEIHKVYTQGKIGFHALKDINLYFEKGEFISIFGPSGCGKTTLLNIIGGLDTPTSGDMVIDDRLTTTFIEKEWDYFRNHRIGFIFQQYNLVEHLPIVENVALSSKLSGIKDKIAKEQAKELLIKVGLEDHLEKLPGELSGGERQRVAIARALINDPDIVLADEPTGALDKKTGIEIMNLIKEICTDKLVIMVTHNRKIADMFSTRIIQLKDGRVFSDSSPLDKRVKIIEKRKHKKTKLKFKEAIRLSLFNIKGKKWRTLLVSLGLSIGIVGLILIDSLFNSVRVGLEQQNEVLVSNPDVYIYTEYQNNPDIDQIRQDILHYNHFNEVLYSPQTEYGIFENITEDTLLNNPYYGYGIKLTQNSNLQETFTSLIGDSRFPSNDNEMMINIKTAQQLINANVSLTDNEIWEQIKGNTYLIYDEYSNSPSESSLFNQINDSVCVVGGIWDEDPNTTPIGYNTVEMGAIADNMAALDLYTTSNLIISDSEQLYCSDYSSLEWQTNYNLPYGQGREVTLVGIHDNKLFTEIIFSDNILNSNSGQPNISLIDNSIYNTGIRFRGFLKQSAIDNKFEVIQEIEKDGFFIQENFNNSFDFFNGLTDFFMYILQFIFSSIVFIAILTGGLMLLMILLISIIERKREIGLIRAMGGTRSDVRVIYTGETTIIGLIAGIISVILSIILVAIGNVIIYNNYFELVVENLPFVDPKHVLSINYWKLFFAILGSIGIAIISGLIPAIKASRKKPIEALRNE